MAMAVELMASARPTMIAAGQAKPISLNSSGDGDTGRHHLGEAEPEDLVPHAPEFGRIDLKADEEQHHDDAELGDLADRSRCR